MAPLHRCPRVIAAVTDTGVKCLFLCTPSLQSRPVLILRVDIVVIFYGIHGAVSHSDLLSLIEKWKAAKKDINSRQHLDSSGIYRILRQIRGRTTGLIVIFDDIGQKPHVLNLQLGFDYGLLPFGEFDWLCVVPAVFPSCQQMSREIEHRRKVTIFSHKFLQFLFPHIKYFRNRKCLIRIEGLLPQLLQQLADPLDLFHHFGTGSQPVGTVCREIREIRILFNIDDGVDPESGHPFFQPPADHGKQFFLHLRIIPV